MDEENDARNLYHPVEEKYWKLNVSKYMTFRTNAGVTGL
jgi:hypothetical protein